MVSTKLLTPSKSIDGIFDTAGLRQGFYEISLRTGRTGLGKCGWTIRPRPLSMCILRGFLCVLDDRRALFYCISYFGFTIMHPQRGVWCQTRHTPFLLAYFVLHFIQQLTIAESRDHLEKSFHAAHRLSDYPSPSPTAGTSSPNSLIAFSPITPLKPSSSPSNTSRIASRLVFTLGHSLSSSSVPICGKNG